MAKKPVLSSKSDFHPNSAYRSVMNKIPVKIKMPKDVVANYINAMDAYDTLESEENYRNLEAAKKVYKEFLASKQCKSGLTLTVCFGSVVKILDVCYRIVNLKSVVKPKNRLANIVMMLASPYD